MDTDDLDYCGKCGIYFNIYVVKRIENDDNYDNSITYVCPGCEAEVAGEE